MRQNNPHQNGGGCLILEKYGRQAFAKSDLVAAEGFAIDILKMMFRPEGTNLLADVYIKKIEIALASGDKSTARSAYDYIKDYEISPDRRTKLELLPVIVIR